VRYSNLLVLAAVASLLLGAQGCEKRNPNALHVIYKCKFTSSAGDIPLHVMLDLGSMEGRILSSDTGVSVRPITSVGEFRMGTVLSGGQPNEVRIRPDGTATLLAKIDLKGVAREVPGKCSRI
jgi:hypothetical protein